MEVILPVATSCHMVAEGKGGSLTTNVFGYSTLEVFVSLGNRGEVVVTSKGKLFITSESDSTSCHFVSPGSRGSCNLED